MTQEETKKLAQEYDALCVEVEKHNELYYKKGTPAISDAEYDAMYRRLEQIEAAHPWLKSPASPTNKVGDDTTEGFPKIKHEVPMLSIDDVFEQRTNTPYEDIKQWCLRVELTEPEQPFVVVEPKIDGCAITLYYEKGKLKYAATRGTGTQGDMITANAKTIKSIPHELPGSADSWPEVIEVRGEVYMDLAEFDAWNASRVAEGKPELANPRNATAGSLKLLDSAEVAKRPLRFIAHGLGKISAPERVTNVQEFYRLMDDMHMPSLHRYSTCGRLRETTNAIDELRSKILPTLPYNTDGAVVKMWNYTDRERLGYTSRAPKWAAAFKFLPERKQTKLNAITLQVGRTGVLTPVAELEPIHLAGTTVSRATLHNQDCITKLDVRIGDLVAIEKAGEIIPAVVEVNMSQRSKTAQPYDIMEVTGGKCPVCGGVLEREEGKAAICCTNPNCPAQLAAKVENMCKRAALDIADVGPAIVEALIEEGYVRIPIDLFGAKPDLLAELIVTQDEDGTSYRLGSLMATKICKAIENAFTLPLDRWLVAFGIPGVGDTTARKLTQLIPDWRAFQTGDYVKTLCDCYDLVNVHNNAIPKRGEEDRQDLQMLRAATINAIMSKLAAGDYVARGYASLDQSKKQIKLVSALGSEALVRKIVAWLSSLAARQASALFESPVRKENPVSDNYVDNLYATNGGKLTGKLICITGTLSQDRAYFARIIEDNGGKVASSVTKKTTHLLAGVDCGSKLDKAQSLGLPILTEEEFMAMING